MSEEIKIGELPEPLDGLSMDIEAADREKLQSVFPHIALASGELC